ncbi:MAG: hypothetical protein EP329_21075 [Deltaproteobacteria bacterium]|nr:MAG: hypothetical protein EP329_21075 [Deltaproteobacteria bacterium]
MSVLARFVPFALSLFLALPLTACADPCGELEVKVCQAQNPNLKRQYANACKLMQEPARRDNLTKDACESILNHLSKR